MYQKLIYSFILVASLSNAQELTQCSVNSDCDQTRACIDELCGDPCVGSCGSNTQCRIINHVPICSCRKGFSGDPFSGCQESTTTTAAPKIDPCQPSPCGPYSVCTQANDQAVCSCETGYIGSPPNCHPECTISAQCSADKACVNEKCVNPCFGSCGRNADCGVVTHIPICTCPPGFNGDPFLSCHKNKDKVSTSTTSRPFLTQIPAYRPSSGRNRCEPNPCGLNAVCMKQNGLCDCQSGYTGDPYSIAGCRPAGPGTLTTTLPTSPPALTSSTTVKTPSGKCLLPPYPDNGSYDTNILGAEPGQSHQLVVINVTCHRGFGVVGPSSTFCHNGYWPQEFPKCVSMCTLDTHPSVEYLCLATGSDEGYRPCTSREPSGTIVNPTCRRPNYYAATTLHLMRCIGGNWNYIAKCNPECGKVTPEGVDLVAGGIPAKRGELPWHAGIYKKTFNPYKQVCGGSLISNNIVISAAHCFWNDLEKQLPASQFAVAVGKIYRAWNDPVDQAQKSDVQEIHIPPRFRGAATNFQDDVAVLILTDAFEYKTFIRPVCLSFDINIERLQLPGTTKGKVAGWGLTSENGKESSILQVIDLPLVEISTCLAKLPFSFQEYITSDKICAGYQEANAGLCKGDSGGGLAFPVTDRGTLRYYLHGVVSTAPNDDNVKCNTATYTTFTQVLKHELFIKRYWNEI